MSIPSYLAPQPYNSIIDADSYKVPHWMLYRDGLKTVYSFIESRGGEHDGIMLAGLQPYLYEKLGQPIQDWEIEEASSFFAKHFGFSSYFNRKLWDEIVNKHDRKLPLMIRAVPEGVLIPKKTPLLSVENTGSAITAALTSYKETSILRNVWPASSIATRVFRMKQRVKPFYDETSDNGISPFAVLDFSSRGVFGDDHSKLAGAVFCFFFQGSDNMLGIRHANYYYHHGMAAYSVMASEHSIASGFGVGNDDDYIDHCLAVAPEGAILSLVGDTWDIFKFTKALVREDRKAIIANKKLSIVDRPDSGTRHEVMPDILRTLANGFGTTKNNKGYDVINCGVKVLWADGMNERTVVEPFEVAKQMGISADSVITGSGGGIAAADLDRDTDKWAMKASEYTFEDGTRLDVFKDPITDKGKQSKKGRFAVTHAGERGQFAWQNRPNNGEVGGDIMVPRFINGSVVNAHRLDEIRAIVDSQL